MAHDAQSKQCSVEYVQVSGLGRPVGEYSPVVSVRGARLLFVAGKVAIDEKGKIVGLGNIEAQCRQVMKNLKGALEAAGATLDDVIKITALLTDRAHAATWVRVRREFFTKNLPASTGFIVGALASDEYMIEVDAIAAVCD